MLIDFLSVSYYIKPYCKSKPPQDDQKHCCNVDQRIPGIFCVASRPQDVNARITEGRNRMKHRIPDSADHSILRHKLKGIEQCSRSLYYKCADNDLFYHTDHSAQLIHIIGFLENHPLLYCDFFSQYQKKCSSTSYDSYPADL